MSQQEIKDTLEVLLPCCLVGMIVSFGRFLSRHFRKEPFRAWRLAIGLFTGAINAGLIGMAVHGAGFNYALTWSLAGFAVHMGSHWVDQVLSDYCYKKLGLERRKDEKR